MTVGEKIRQLREEKGMSQDELAKKVGYKSRSSIQKIEKLRSLPMPKIELMAKALEISPYYLMGWIDTPLMEDHSREIQEYYAKGDELSLEETEIIERYRISSDDTKNAICSILGIKRQDTPLKSSRAV